MTPIDTVAAPLIPDIAANMVQMITVPMANPPGTGPIQRCIRVYRSSATPARSKIMAMKMKSGMASRVNFPMAP